MYNLVELGLSIRSKREDKNLSREKLAEACNISDKCISRIEHGKSNPKTTTLVAICRELGINSGELSKFYKSEGVIKDV